MKRTPPTVRLLTRALSPLVVAGILLAACGGDDEASTSTLAPAPRVTVTSVQGDTTSELLAAVYARVLEDGGFRVARRDPVALDRAGYYQQVQDGTIDLIPDWSGALADFLYSQPDAPSAPTTVLPDSPASTEAPVFVTTTSTTSTTVADTTPDTGGSTTTSSSTSTSSTTSTTSTTSTSTTVAESTTTTTIAPNGRGELEQIEAIRAALADSATVNNGFAAEDNLIIACTDEAMKAHADVQLLTYTNLASIAPEIRLATTAEWRDDEQVGLPAWTLIYGGEFKEIVTVDSPIGALKAGEAECGVVESLDTTITAESMAILIDDKSLTPSNVAIALLNSEAATPDLVAMLDSISAYLTTERLNAMLNQVAQGTPVAVVANAFVDTI